MTNAIVAVTDVTASYGDNVAPVLGPISLEVHAGEFLTIVGASGCGKTTLLNCIGGHLPVRSGSIRIGNTQVDRPLPQIGTVFQRPNLLPWLRVVDNVAFGLQMHGISTGRRRSVGHDMLRVVGLDAKVDAMYPWELSGGMQQRAAIARSLAISPELLLMDEPFGSLDAITREHMQEEIGGMLRRMSATVIFITHDVDEAIVLGDRVVVLGGPPGTVRGVHDTAGVHTRDPLLDPVSAERWLAVRGRILADIRGAER